MNLRPQRGGFLVGMLVGLLVGMLVSLAIALYVTKMPVPFVNKVPQRSPAQDQAEAERNRNWDPNAPLAGRSGPAKTPAASAPAAGTGAAPVPAPAPARDPAAILAGKSQQASDNAPIPGAVSALPQADPFLYFVQAGAYAKSDDADQQRARLAMMGVAAKVTEREQSGRTVYRVRVGPYEKKDEAEAMRDRLKNEGVDSALVRVNK